MELDEMGCQNSILNLKHVFNRDHCQFSEENITYFTLILLLDINLALISCSVDNHTCIVAAFLVLNSQSGFMKSMSP